MKLFLRLMTGGACFLAAATNALAQPASETNSPASTNVVPQCVHWRTVRVKPEEHAPRIHFYNKLNPLWWFKNADDPKPPEWYRPEDKHRNLKWNFRNPMHNFNFYVIGVVDKKFSRSGKFPDRNSDPRGGWNFAATRYKFIYLPFLSYHRLRFDFYFGWRNRGNFGIKVHVNSKNESDKDAESGSDALRNVRKG